MKSVVVLVLLAATCAGCVAVRGTLSAPLEPWPPGALSGTPPSVSLYIEGETVGDASLGEGFAQWREETLRAYRNSGLFHDVVAGLQDKDFKIHVLIRYASEFSHTNAVLTGLTFFVFPLVEQQDLTVRTEFRSRSGAELTFEHSQSNHIWTQLLLLPVTPIFTAPRNVAQEIVYDLNRATLVEARARLAAVLASP
jgi:hypothetical protein